MNFLSEINKNWTLFLDRDGVINRRPVDDYVKNWNEFEFLPGVLEAIKTMSQIFGKIIIITNQQGIGKGLMTVEDLASIHKKMISEIEKDDGKIDAVYFCPELKELDKNCRKPGTAMASMAKVDFPEINFKKSVMVGDTLTDMQFGRNVFMKTVFINSGIESFVSELIDIEFDSLFTFSKVLFAND